MDGQTDGRSDCTPRPAFTFGDAGKNNPTPSEMADPLESDPEATCTNEDLLPVTTRKSTYRKYLIHLHKGNKID